MTRFRFHSVERGRVSFFANGADYHVVVTAYPKKGTYSVRCYFDKVTRKLEGGRQFKRTFQREFIVKDGEGDMLQKFVDAWKAWTKGDDVTFTEDEFRAILAGATVEMPKEASNG